MEQIDLKELCGTDIVTREHGTKINKLIRAKWDEDGDIVVDFKKTSIASVSFLDEAIGILALDYDLEEIKRRIHLVNMTSFDERLLTDILESRQRQKRKNKNPR